MNELAPGVIHVQRNAETGLWRFRVVGCTHIARTHGSLQAAERCSMAILESRAAPPKTEKTG